MELVFVLVLLVLFSYGFWQMLGKLYRHIDPPEAPPEAASPNETREQYIARMNRTKLGKRP